MSFIHRDFLWFLPLVWSAWYLLRGRYRQQIALLLCASLVFYGWHRPGFIGLIGAYAVADWSVGLWLGRTRRPKAVLVLGLIFNLGLLCFFKYRALFLTTLAALAHRPEIASGIGNPADWVAPMGLSFYSFTGIAYMVDVYRRAISPEKNLWRFSLFSAFFPQLVAGPILRPREFLTHLRPAELPSRPDAPLEAIALVARGYFKKLVLADNIGFVVDPFFANIAQPSTAGVWSFPYLFLYSWQIYFDFSGYTDIARGLGLAFGFRWPENFRGPYLAGSMREFWRRWHMTLSRFMRDYLFIPLGGSRQGAAGTIFAILTTMTLCGFWHGASWTFLLWGLLHGLALLINRGWEQVAPLRRAPSLLVIPGSIRRAAAVVLTFSAVTLLWAFFRLTHLAESVLCLVKLVSFDQSRALFGGAADPSVWALLALYGAAVFLLGAVRQGESTEDFFAAIKLSPYLRGVIAGGATGLLIVSILLARLGEKTPFIYFQF